MNLLIDSEIEKIRKVPRFTPIEIEFLGKKIKIIDSASFLSSYREIFENEIYRFKCEKESPLIIDCGSNIGLSLIFFKKYYPKVRLIGFEPAPEVFQILQHNLDVFGYQDIQLFKKAIWTEETELKFTNEGADGGRLPISSDTLHPINVQTVNLRRFINEPVDFLKLDIEGAETKVLGDLKESLSIVENIFVEYHSLANKKQTLDILLNCLIENGFRIHIHSANFSRYPFLEIKTYFDYDLQLNIFGIRERK